MSAYDRLSKGALADLHQELEQKFEAFKAQKLSLDMTRGKPCSEQLDLANELLGDGAWRAADGTDCRNYGGLDGIPEAKELFAWYLGVAPQEVLIAGNSSLELMHDTVARAFSHGLPESARPWSKETTVKALCPAPGYDRHFRISEHYGMELVTVDMREDGPDMDQVERLAAEDAAVKLIWLVPRYSNPLGVTFSDRTVERLARMPVKAADFRIIWDDAYAVHHLGGGIEPLKSILDECKAAGSPDRAFLYGSTSKISFAGAGVGFMGGSVRNIEWMKSQIFVKTVGPDKLNMLRHVRYFKDMRGILAHMDKHAAILGPKFDAALSVLEEELSGKEIAFWTRPRGGYFISLDTLDGCAKKVVARCKEAGVLLTQAGATFPGGKDPRDRNIRLAPTYPSLSEVRQAMEVLALCIQLVSIEQKLSR